VLNNQSSVDSIGVSKTTVYSVPSWETSTTLYFLEYLPVESLKSNCIKPSTDSNSTLDSAAQPFISILNVLAFGCSKPVALVNKEFIAGDPAVPEADESNLVFVFKKSGASFSIAITLYLALSWTKISVSAAFFNIKKVSSSTLFLSDDGNDSHKLPSSAL